jgi:hypothetical protein
MFFALIGVSLATAFGLVAYSIYGPDGLTDNAWIESVFWWLIVTGAVAGYLERPIRCDLCHRFAVLGPLCRVVPCR